MIAVILAMHIYYNCAVLIIKVSPYDPNDLQHQEHHHGLVVIFLAINYKNRKYYKRKKTFNC